MARAAWVPDEKVMAKVRKLCASLEDVREHTAWGHPVWRTAGRQFAAYEPKQGQDYLFFLVEKEMLAALLENGDRFRDGGFPTGDAGWIGLRLDARTDWAGEVKDLFRRSQAYVSACAKKKKPARRRAARAPRS